MLRHSVSQPRRGSGVRREIIPVSVVFGGPPPPSIRCRTSLHMQGGRFSFTMRRVPECACPRMPRGVLSDYLCANEMHGTEKSTRRGLKRERERARARAREHARGAHSQKRTLIQGPGHFCPYRSRLLAVGTACTRLCSNCLVFLQP